MVCRGQIESLRNDGRFTNRRVCAADFIPGKCPAASIGGGRSLGSARTLLIAEPPSGSIELMITHSAGKHARRPHETRGETEYALGKKASFPRQSRGTP